MTQCLLTTPIDEENRLALDRVKSIVSLLGGQCVNPFLPKTPIDFTLFNARRFYLSVAAIGGQG